MGICVPSFSKAKSNVRAQSMKRPVHGTLWAMGTGDSLKEFKKDQCAYHRSTRWLISTAPAFSEIRNRIGGF